ncbi:hypothetical protein [Neisseria polysaccharea]|uniref:hypothetical protein n=1 Tax=Neisseria polysaccharea TaxID=489 RepID=UPI0027E0FCBB|nr:hypothetical protein [Neisseria polysaccharea]
MPSERRRCGIKVLPPFCIDSGAEKAMPAACPIPKRQCSATARVLLTNMRLRGTIAHSFQMNILPENTGKRPTKHLT